MGCFACGRGFHRECGRKGKCKKCHPYENNNVPAESTVVPNEAVETENDNVLADEQANSPRIPKSKNLKDPESTGRKRAARLYPIENGAACEWRGKKNCGGGRRPVIGCYDGIQQHRHHGPVKRTTRNELGNVHRICDNCHVHWHELNDLIYEEADYGLLPHDPIPATDEETILNALEWKSGVMGKKFQLASSQNLKKAASKNGEC